MLVGMILQILFGLATGFAPTYELHIIFRAMVAATCSLMCSGIMILVDIFNKKYRIIVMCLFENFWSIGVMLLPFVGSFWQSWRLVYVAISLPTIFLLLIYFWIPNSPRWLLKHGRVKEAVDILLDAARINKQEVDESKIECELNNLSKIYRNEPEAPSVWSIWEGNYRHKLHLFIAHLGWTIYLSLFFASLLHVKSLGKNYLEINTVIAGMSEVLGTFIGLFFILKTTNKWMWASIFNIFTSLISVLANFLPHDRIIFYLATIMVMKATISSTLILFITCTSELVEEKKKSTFNYSGVTCSRTFVMAAPFIGYCSSFGSALIPQNIMIFLNIAMSITIIIFIKSPATILNHKLNQKHESEEIEILKINDSHKN